MAHAGEVFSAEFGAGDKGKGFATNSIGYEDDGTTQKFLYKDTIGVKDVTWNAIAD